MDEKFLERLVWLLSNDGLWKKVALHFKLLISRIEDKVRTKDLVDQKSCAALVVEHVSELLPPIGPNFDAVKFRTSWLVFLRGCDLMDVAGILAVESDHRDLEWMSATSVSLPSLRSRASLPPVCSIDEAFYPSMVGNQRGYAEYKCAMHGLLEICMPAIETLVRAFISVVLSRPASLVRPTFASTSLITIDQLRDSRTLEWLIITPEFDPLLVFVFAHVSEHVAKNCECPFTGDRIHKFRKEINARLRSDLVFGWMMQGEQLIERMCTKYREMLDALSEHDDNWKVLMPDSTFIDLILAKNDSLRSEFLVQFDDGGEGFRPFLRASGKKHSELVELFRPLWEDRCASDNNVRSRWYDYPLSVSALSDEARKFIQ